MSFLEKAYCSEKSCFLVKAICSCLYPGLENLRGVGGIAYIF